MTSPTHHRQRAAEATAARAQNWAPPPPPPFPDHHPAPTNNQADPFQPLVAGPSHAPDAPDAPDPTPRRQVAALQDQIAAISTRHRQAPIL